MSVAMAVVYWQNLCRTTANVTWEAVHMVVGFRVEAYNTLNSSGRPASDGTLPLGCPDSATWVFKNPSTYELEAIV